MSRNQSECNFGSCLFCLCVRVLRMWASGIVCFLFVYILGFDFLDVATQSKALLFVTLNERKKK